MKKLIYSVILLAAFAVTSIAAPSVNLSAGYREKGIAFGKVFDEKGAYVLGADAKWNSFHFAGGIENHGSLGSIELYRATALAGYKFFSTLVDVEVGSEYEVYNHPGKYDFKGGHFQPFVTLSKGWVSVTGQMDLESKLSNIEASISKTVKVSKIDVTSSIFAGYTDVNDWSPRSIKEIKFTNAYYGGKVDLTWKMISVGATALHCGQNGKTTLGWNTALVYRY